jgi:hypothetical protein
MSFLRPSYRVSFPPDFAGRVVDESWMKGYLFGVALHFDGITSISITVIDEFTASDDPAWLTSERNVLVVPEVRKELIEQRIAEVCEQGQFDLILAFALAGWNKRLGCTVRALLSLSEVRAPLPEYYRWLMFWSNGGEVTIKNRMVELWSAEEAAMQNASLSVPQGYLGIGTVDSLLCAIELRVAADALIIGSGKAACVTDISAVAQGVFASKLGLP